MPKEDWAQNPVHEVLRRAGLWSFGSIESVLDVACGLSLKSKFLPAQIRVGIDVHEPYLRAIESDVPYVVMKGDVRNLREHFLENSFDIVYALNIVEHLEKEEALQLVGECKSIAKLAVVLDTPNGYVPQNIDIQGFGADHWETHRCGWTVSEFEDLGFHCDVRPYTMSDIKRHTELDVDTHIEIITAIWCKPAQGLAI